MAEQQDRMLHDLEAQDREVKQPKIVYSGDVYVGQPYVLVSEEDIVLAADRKAVLSISSAFGVLLGGRISLSCLPAELSFGGGYWRLDPRHLATIPSTTPTPIPLLVKSTPALLKAKKDLNSAIDYMKAGSDIV